MDKKDEAIQSAPLVDDEHVSRPKSNTGHRLRTLLGMNRQHMSYLWLFIFFLILEAVNVFFFIGIPSLARKTVPEIRDSLDERE